MTSTMQNSKVVIPEYPITVNLGEWVIEHPECDSICERIGTGPNYLIYAYATDKDGNGDLEELRDEKFSEKKILEGVSLDGIRRLI